MRKLNYFRRSLLTLVMLISGIMFASAQTDLFVNPSSLTSLAGPQAITFKVTNNNASVIQVQKVIYPLLVGIPAGTYTLYHSTTDLTTNSPNLSVGWTTDAVVNQAAVTTGAYYYLFSGLSININPGQTVRFVVNVNTGGTLVYGGTGTTPTSLTSVDNVLLNSGISGSGAGWRFTAPNGAGALRNFAGGITYQVLISNDLAITNIYTQGTVPVGYGVPQTISTRIANVGLLTMPATTATLTITGSNPFTTTAAVGSIAPGGSEVVSFSAYTPTTVGSSTITVSIPTDDQLSNNSSVMTQTDSKDINGYSYSTPPITQGVGFTGATGDFVGRFFSANNFGNSDTINGFQVFFTSTGQPYQIGVWTDNAGEPGTNIYTSPTYTTAAGTVFKSLPDIEVSGTYYVGILQTGITNVGFGYQAESPVRFGDFFYTSPTGGTTWADFGDAGADFRISATVQYKTPVPPNCAVYLTPPNAGSACLSGTTLTWGSGGGGPTGYRLYFGTNQALVEAEDPGTLVQNSAATSYNTGALISGSTYYWRVTAYNVQGDASACITSQSFGASLVSCYCTSTSTNGTFEHITNVESGIFSNPSGSTLYSDYTGLGIINNVNIGSTFNVTVTIDPLNVFDEDRILVYADFNHDGDWNDPGELCGNMDVTIAGGNVYVVNCTVPISALSGNTLLRIKMGDEVSTTAMSLDPCQATYTYGEVEDYLLNLTCGASATSNTPVCENGALNLTATHLGDGNPTSYSWTTTAPNGFTSSSATPTLNTVSSIGDNGDYTVVITDDNGCTASSTVTVNISPSPIPGASSNSPVCEGITINMISGDGTSYVWSGPNSFTSASSSPSIANASISDAGDYTVVVTNSFGCSTSQTITVAINPNPTLSVVTNGVSCVGSCDGDATVTATGGTPLYLFTDGMSLNFDGIFTDEFCEGAQTVDVIDNNGCESTIGFSIGHISSAPPASSLYIPAGTYPVSGCVGQTVNVSCNTVPGATNYSWSVNPGTLINGQPGPVVTTTPNATLTLGSIPSNVSNWEICVFAFNGCGQTNTKCFSIRGNLSTPAPISGSTVACPSSSGAYSTSTVGGAEGYQWTGTNGITFTGSGTSVTANFPVGFTSGTICVSATLSCGYVGPTRCISVSNSSPNLGAMSGPFSLCPGAINQVFSVPAAAGAASYTWSVPANISIVSGQGTPNLTVDAGSTFTQGQICVYATSNCGIQTSPRCKTIASTSPLTPGNITGQSSGICGQTVTYSVPAVAGVTSYNWSVTGAGASLASANGTNTINVSFSGGFTTGSICVVAVNACGTSASRCINVKGAPADPAAISGPSTVCAFDAGVSFSIPAVQGATGYVWTVPSGAAIMFGTNTNSIIVDWGGTSGLVTVRATNGCGTSGTKTLNVTVGCKVSGNALPGTEVTAYPNPVRNLLTVEMNTDNSGTYAVNIHDITGRIVYSSEMKIVVGLNQKTIDVSGLNSGIYMLEIRNADGYVNQLRVTVQ